MERDIEIWTGIAGSGKTEALLAEYRTVLKADAEQQLFGRTVWLTPTNESRQHIFASLPNEQFPVCFAPNVMTFASFAEHILRFTNAPVEKISPIVQQRLLRNLIDELHQSEQLPYFSSIASSSGFLQLVGSLIAEFKRDEIWPEQLIEACSIDANSVDAGSVGTNSQKALSNKNRELAAIYTAYQNALLATKRYDSEGRFWAARDAVDQFGLGPFSQLSLVIVDGFTHFTRTQYELLEHLANATQQMRISLLLESPLLRTDLFAKSQQAEEQLTQRLKKISPIKTKRFSVPEISISKNNASSSSIAATFQQISQNLFTNPRDVIPIDESNGLEILAVTGPIREVELLAKRVKQQLLDGTAAEEIAIAYRSLDEESANLICEKFRAANIPFWCSAGKPLLREPLLRALFDLLHLELEDWPFERLMSMIRSNFFRPNFLRSSEAESSAGHMQEQPHAEMASALADALRIRKLHSSRHIMLRVLQREKENAEKRIADKSLTDAARSSATKTQKKLDPAVTLLEFLSQATERLRGQTDFASWVERTVELARELGIAPSKHSSAAEPSSVKNEQQQRQQQHDVDVWNLFERLLFEAIKADNYQTDNCQAEIDSKETNRTMSLSEFIGAVTELLETEQLPNADHPRGSVRIVDVARLRHLEVPYLFLAGLTEASFPSRRADDCLYGETERQRLNELGLPLGHRSSHGQEEMLLFYGVATRARKSLTLSYPEIDSTGKPLFPSPYVNAIRELFTADSLQVKRIGQLDPVPQRDNILTATDWRRVATAEVFERRAGLFLTLCSHSETESAARNILASVTTNIARFRTNGWTAFDGKLSHSALTDYLARQFPADYQFSTTQLETYAKCGFQFFLSDLLRIAPLESPHVATDRMARGNVVHEVLSLLHTELSNEEILSGELSDNDAENNVAGKFRAYVDGEIERRISETDLQKALQHLEQKLLHEWSDEYHAQWDNYCDGIDERWDNLPLPRYLEMPFGDVPNDRSDTPANDSGNKPLGPLTIGNDESRTFIRGRIDRIDVGSVNKTPVFNLIDYKTGVNSKQFNVEQIASGESLQLALYTIAILRFKLLGDDAKPFQLGYWHIAATGFVSGMKKAKPFEPIDASVIEEIEQLLDELIPQLAQKIRTGFFPIDSSNDDCTKWCPHKTVCRITQLRPLREPLQKVSKLIDSPEQE